VDNQKVTIFTGNQVLNRAGGGKTRSCVIGEIYNIAGGDTSHPSELVLLRHAKLLQLLYVYISTVICRSISLCCTGFRVSVKQVPFALKM
jgi:hypothetical protein